MGRVPGALLWARSMVREVGGLTFHHIRHVAIGVNAANVFGVSRVGTSIKDEGCGDRKGHCWLVHRA